jgi:large subunit ribosomal protein L21
MEFIIFKSGGKQYKVKVGDVLDVDRISGEKNQSIELSDVLLWASDKELKIGKPTLDGVKVKAFIVDQIKGEKIRVAKFKAKVRYRRVMGFRPLHTTLKIESIAIGSAKSLSAVEPAPISKAKIKTPKSK